MIKYFSVPADFKKKTIDQYVELNNAGKNSVVHEVYGQLTSGDIVNSGRVVNVLPKVDLNELEHYVAYVKEAGIIFNYTLNPSCFGNLEFTRDGMSKIKKLLVQLHEIGIQWLTITSPSLIELVKSLQLDFKIKASAICEIISPSKAEFYKYKGADRIVTDPDITRDFSKLKGIVDSFGTGVEIIINNVCLRNCAYKMFHYNHEAHCSGDSVGEIIDYYTNRCSMQKARSIENYIKLNWIRPEDLHYYSESGIWNFKIQGRQNVVNGDIIKVLKAYTAESYEGNLMELITLFSPYSSFQPYIDNHALEGYVKPFFEKQGFCKEHCKSCGYCGEYAKRSMDSKKAKELNKKAELFFLEYDSFTKELNLNQEIRNKKSINEKQWSTNYFPKF